MYEYQDELVSCQSETTSLRARNARPWGMVVGLIVGSGVAAVSMQVAHADDVSGLLGLALSELNQANTDLGNAIDTAKNAPVLSASFFEYTDGSLDAQHNFQGGLANFLDSLPTNIPKSDETNSSLVNSLQLLTGDLGEGWMVSNDHSLEENVVGAGQAVSLTIDNASGWTNDGALMLEEVAVQNAFNSLGLG